MPVTFSCPDCQAELKTANPVPAGKKIKCPKCQAIFAAPAEDAEPKPAAAKGTPRPQAPSLRKPPVPDDDDNGDLPRPSARKPVPADDDEDDDSREQIADKPLRKRVRVDDLDDDEDDYEDDYEEEDQPRRKSKKRGKKSGKGLLIGIIAGSVLAVLLAVGAVAAWVWPGFLISYTNKGTGNEDPLAYVPADSTMVFGFDGNTLLNNPAFGPQLQAQLQKTSDEKDLFDDCKASTGLEFKELFDRFIVAGKGSFPGGAALMAANSNQDETVVLQSKVPFNQKTVGEHFTGAERVKVNGKFYYKRTRSTPGNTYTYLFMPSDRILVLTKMPQNKLEAMINSDGSQPALAADTLSMARAAEKGAAWLVLPVSGSIKQLLGQFSSPAVQAQTPPELKPALSALPNAKTLGVWGSLDGQKASLHVALLCADNAGAKNVAGGLQTWWQANTKGATGLLIRAPLFKLPRSVQKIADEILSSTRFTSQGALAKASAQAKMQSVEALVKDLPTLTANLGGMQQGVPAPGAPGIPGRGRVAPPGRTPGRFPNPPRR